MLTTIELFAGIAGFSSPHTRPVAFVEKDANCRAVLRRHYPGVVILEDVRDAGAHNLPRANILKFGFPCQDLSVAGNRAGLQGSRSGLFYEGTRIAHELRPDYVLWENVPGLLSSGAGRDFLAVLTELDRIGLAGGWTTVDAQFFGVAQRRCRVFGVFARRDIGAARCAEILSLAARLPWNLTPGRKERANVTACVGSGIEGNSGVAHTLTANYGKQVDSSDTNQGPPNLIMAFRQNQDGYIGHGDITNSLSATSGMNQTQYVAVPAIAQSNRGHETGDVFETLRSGSHGALPMVAAALGAAATYDRGDGCDNLIVGGERVRYALTAHHGRNSGEDEFIVAGTLGAMHGRNRGLGQENEIDFIVPQFGVRRLTPRECERLQGFEDDHTAWGIGEDGQRIEMSDSVRYRMLGNAICRKVSAWIDSQVALFAS